eukprot:40153-Amphidinium_carterae.1
MSDLRDFSNWVVRVGRFSSGGQFLTSVARRTVAIPFATGMLTHHQELRATWSSIECSAHLLHHFKGDPRHEAGKRFAKTVDQERWI